MEHDDPIPKKNKEKKLAKKRKSESAKADQEEVVRNYGIDRLNIGEAKHDLDDSEWLLVKRRIGQMENLINKEKMIIHEYNVLNNILNPVKQTKYNK